MTSFFGVGEDRCFVSCGRFCRDVVGRSVTALSIEGVSASTGTSGTAASRLFKPGEAGKNEVDDALTGK